MGEDSLNSSNSGEENFDVNTDDGENTSGQYSPSHPPQNIPETRIPVGAKSIGGPGGQRTDRVGSVSKQGKWG